MTQCSKFLFHSLSHDFHWLLPNCQLMNDNEYRDGGAVRFMIFVFCIGPHEVKSEVLAVFYCSV